MIPRRTAVALLASPLLLTGCGGAEATEPRTPARRPAPAAPGASTDPARRRIPGLGPERSARIPGRCAQAVVVTGRGADSPLCTVVLHRRTAAGSDGVRAGGPGPRNRGTGATGRRHRQLPA
ncbi:hypothetical protein AB0N19_28600, partial [Streptomyces sp. NPDC051132]